MKANILIQPLKIFSLKGCNTALIVFVGSLIISISANISVLIWPVPITMQSFMIIAISSLLGCRLAFMTLSLYLLEGLVGFPVFKGLSGGLFYFSGPTGGYLIGFLLSAYGVGYLSDKGWGRNILTSFGLFFVGELFIHLPGIIWLSVFFSAAKVFAINIMLIYATAIKIILGTLLITRIKYWLS
jgi:biotin transport system substrate-specific component